MIFTRSLQVGIAVLVSTARLSIAAPHHYTLQNDTSTHIGSSLILQDLQIRDTKPFYLRIAPVGASIVNGYGSPENNGFRKYFRDQLRYAGWPVNMVGSLKTGTMRDGDNEGHIGYRIDQITNEYLATIIKNKPNLIIMNIGTNNAGQNIGVSNWADLNLLLLDQLFAGIPGVTIIMSTLLPNKGASLDANAKNMNDQVRKTVLPHYRGLNQKLMLAEMDDGFITQNDLNDETHPTDAGYKKMASVWWAAFQKVEKNGWLSPPQDAGFADDLAAIIYSCPKTLQLGSAPVKIQRGSGTDDGPYVHDSEDQGVVWKAPFGVLNSDTSYGNNFFFAQLVNFGSPRGNEVDEIIHASINTDGSYSWQFWLGNAAMNFGDTQSLNLGYGSECPPHASRFADLNNDGLDDYVCILNTGAVQASLNRGGNPPVFEKMGVIGKAPAFWTGSHIFARFYMADIDGDGRADMCFLNEERHMFCLRNGGQGDLPTAAFDGYWQGFKSSGSEDWVQIFGGTAPYAPYTVVLTDLNGDFKADWLIMDQTGLVNTFINNRGSDDGLIPDWQFVGRTHAGGVTLGIENANSTIKFGRMFGTGRRDYIWIKKDTASSSSSSISLQIIKNTGSGGTMLKADGTTYCDMDGDGKDDYVWIGPDGLIDIYLNNQTPPYWTNYGSVIILGISRKTIHVADLNGDGKCDLLSVDKATGSVRMWLNNWNPTTQRFGFADKGIISGGVRCTEGYGVIEYDLGVRFADLTGDGRADYLCIERNGHVTGYLNRGMSAAGQVSFESVGQIKSTTYWDRQNIRFNDVNGDGRADLLWINKYNGDTTVQINGGEIQTGASHFFWDTRTVVYSGSSRGSNTIFGALGGQQRADIVTVLPRTNEASVQYNKCASGTSTGGDDPNMADPGLPPYSGADDTCIDDNGDGSCEYELDPNVGISFEQETSLVPFQPLGKFNPSQEFLFDTPATSDITFTLIPLGLPVDWQDTVCGSISALGPEGSTLGCVAISVAWLTYSLYLQGGPISTTPARSLQSSKDHTLQIHADWEPLGECSTKCRLLAGTPPDVWTPMANGSYHGIHHELHFMHTEGMTIHRVYQGLDNGDPRIAGRQYTLDRDPRITSTIPIFGTELYSRDDESLSFDGYFDDYSSIPGGSSLGLARSIGEDFEKAVAFSEVAAWCFMIWRQDGPVSTNVVKFNQDPDDPGVPRGVVEECEDKGRNPEEHIGVPIFVCGRDLAWIDDTLDHDPDTDDDAESNLLPRSLQPRDGSSHPYNVLDINNPSNVVVFNSAAYYNAENGIDLIDHGGDDHRYALLNQLDCNDLTLRDDAAIVGPNFTRVHAEHIFERQTIPILFTFVQNPTIDLRDGNGLTRAPANLAPITFDIIRDFMTKPYLDWPNWAGYNPDPPVAGQSLFTDIAEALGSKNNPGVMTNFEARLNNVKSRVWITDKNVTAHKVWKDIVDSPSTDNTAKALTLLRAGLATFNYLNDANIQNLMGRMHRQLRARMAFFDFHYNALATTQTPTHLEDLWTTFINFWAQRIVNTHRAYINYRIGELRAPWQRILADPTANQQILANAQSNLVTINSFVNQIPATIRFTRTQFV